MAGLETLFQLGICRPVSIVVYASAEPSPRLYQSDLESCVGQYIRSDPASRAASYDTNIESLLSHLFLPEQTERTKPLHLGRLLARKIDLLKQEQPRLSGRNQIDVSVAVDVHGDNLNSWYSESPPALPTEPAENCPPRIAVHCQRATAKSLLKNGDWLRRPQAA